MRNTMSKFGKLAAGATLAAAFVMSAVVALAAGDFGHLSSGYSGSGPASLTIKATGIDPSSPDTSAEDAAFANDIAQADVVIDVYKLADGQQDGSTYSFTVTDDFSALEERIDKAQTLAQFREDGDQTSWQDVANDAALMVDNLTATGTCTPGQKLTGLDMGLYLVIAHGKTVTGQITALDDLTAKSGTYAYTFAPIIISLPTREDLSASWQEQQSQSWVFDATVVLKPTRTPLYGDLLIRKYIKKFSGEPATFVYHVYDTATGGQVYDNYASVYYPSGTENQTLVTKIPAGIEVTVDEEYEGARFRAVGSTTAKATISNTITAEVSFENEPNGSGIQGHGIENNLNYNEETGDWVWTPKPVSAGTNYQAPTE